MLKFFRRIRSKLIDEGNLKRYLFYAIGEILLVVVGILLALQINTWNEERKYKNLEKELLLQFKSDLELDIKAIEYVNFWYEKAGNSCDILVHHLKNRIPFHDSLKVHFDLWNDYESFSFNTGAISNLNSRGVELISNGHLRNQLLTLYNQSYNYHAKNNDFFREDHVHLTYKIHLERIEPIVWRESAIPNDYTALFEDQVFINHVQWIKNAAVFNKMGNEELIKKIHEVIALIGKG